MENLHKLFNREPVRHQNYQFVLVFFFLKFASHELQKARSVPTLTLSQRLWEFRLLFFRDNVKISDYSIELIFK